MESSPDDKPAVTTEARLRELITRGYRFIHPTDADGGVIAVVGIRFHDSVIDMVQLNAEDDVIATRMPGDQLDIFAPTRVLWQVTGHAQHALRELLCLPDDSTPGVPVNGECTHIEVRGCWVPTRPGASAWLPAQV